MMALWVVMLSSSVTAVLAGLQEFREAPTYREVNPGGTVVLPCRVVNKLGECRWEKDGTPVGMYRDKYEWDGDQASGDCSLRVKEANIEYDNGGNVQGQVRVGRRPGEWGLQSPCEG